MYSCTLVDLRVEEWSCVMVSVFMISAILTLVYPSVVQFAGKAAMGGKKLTGVM